MRYVYYTRYILCIALSLAGSTPALSGNVEKSDVMGIKLGMTPDQVTQVLEKSDKGFRTHPTEMVIYDRSFVARIAAQTLSKSNRIADLVVVDFAPPPFKNVAVMIFRSRNYDAGERLSLANVEAAIFKKYGQPVNAQGGGPNRLYDWNEVPANCVKLASYSATNKQYIVQDFEVFSVMSSGAHCPVMQRVGVYGGPDGVRGITTFLLDYPTMYQSALDNSDLGKKWKAEQVKKRANRGGPSDL